MSEPPEPENPSEREPFDGRAIGLLTAGHGFIDLTQGAVAALVPFFLIQHHLSYSAAAVIVLSSSLASSIVQPLFGLYADRASAPWLLPASLLAAGGGLLVAALSPSYAIILVAVAVSGLGVAAFHPEAARLIHFASGKRLTTGMSYFAIGGGLGFAAAPLLVAGLLAVAGTPGLVALIIPAIVLAALYFVDHAHLTALARRHDSANAEAAHVKAGPVEGLRPSRRGRVAVRSSVFAGLNAFLALYWVNALRQRRPPPAMWRSP